MARRLASALALLPAVLATASAASAALPDTSSYVNDGSNSNVALQLYKSYVSDPTSATLSASIAITKVPDDVQSRLAAAGVSDYAELDGRVQRALLWDSGYSLSPNREPMRLYVKSGLSVSELTVTLDEFTGVGCVERNCSQPDESLVYNNLYCNGAQMLNATKCATATFSEDLEVHAAMWSTGGDPDGAPLITLQKHAWESENVSYEVYAVHTMNTKQEPDYDACQDASVYYSYIVPCTGVDKLSGDPESAGYEIPTPSDWVDTWLLDFADTEPSTSSGDGGFNLLYLIPIVAVVLLLVLAVVLLVRRRRHKAKQPAAAYQHESTIDPSALLSPAASGVISTAHYGKPSESDSARPTLSTAVTDGSNTINLSSTQYASSTYADDSESGSNSILRALYSDPNLVGKRLPMEQITLVKALSKGAFGEVWLAELRGEQVAVKRLLQTKQPSFGEFQDFTSEIQLSASLTHPNIIGFIGVAWNSINNLVMVLEFLPGGDLQGHLQRNGDLMSWARDKIHIAVGLARALHYLHSRDPPLIHRDLKSKNVLLTRQLEPKLIDFGVSREQKDDMTAGVGTPYWTAPEVFEGTKYSEKSDIFSFGVLLSELDTCKIPYHDAVSASGAPLKPFQILKEVMAGSLRPSFSADCPDRIQRVAAACLQRDPTARPSAAELVDMLGG